MADLEASLDVKQEKISFSELWETHPPPEAGGMSHDEYMKDVSLFCHLELRRTNKPGLSQLLLPR